MIWAGIDEAGYGPNLGPLVFGLVVAETDEQQHRPELWGPPDGPISKVRGRAEQIWIDDSKRITQTKQGRSRLLATTAWLIGQAYRSSPERLAELLTALGTHRESAEWISWGGTDDADWLDSPARSLLEAMPADLTGFGLPWKLVEVRVEIVGPERFNTILARSRTKAEVHAWAFQQVLAWLWYRNNQAMRIDVLSDQHGGRKSYAGLLQGAIAHSWVERLDESSDGSRYRVSHDGREMTIHFRSKADTSDGLVAAASMVAKSLRELWMDQFNRSWTKRFPTLKPTAGYPVDARRFLAELHQLGAVDEAELPRWWRMR